ncbi:hypothetical protein ABFT51_03360 [Paenibacillus peoriae]|uniref:hypothetical protein n=1 Tax=Paenibacillus peoriae TaxID=59893 RepID=UPI0032AE943B
MDNVHTRIKSDVQQAKNEAKKYIQLPVSELDYLLRLFEELHESKQRLKSERDICKSSFEHWNKEAHRLFSENRIMRKALEWYEDWDSNYDPETLDHLGYIPIDKDGGKRARAALKGEDTP